MYKTRLIDEHLARWAKQQNRKPLLLRGARQVGKSSAIRHLGEGFDNYVEINFERKPQYKKVFESDLDVHRICSQLATLSQQPIEAGKTLLFLDEIQECPQAIMSLRFFKEDYPELHVAAAGSLLEFALTELPTFGVGRIHSMFMYPMTFDEFLLATNYESLLQVKRGADAANPIAEPLHEKLVELFRTYLLVGGMPESVAKWVETHDYMQCQEIQDDILTGYEDDFPKYRKKVDPVLLRQTMRTVAVLATKKFVYAQVPGDYRSAEVKSALDLLMKAGIIIPVTHSKANGLPLEDESDKKTRKMLFFDTGLMLRLLDMTMGDITEITTQILTATAADLVNKGAMAEMLGGLEYLRYLSPNIRHEQYYWAREERNSLAEVDYLLTLQSKIVPMEVKAGVQGGMKSLWKFMHDKNLSQAVRCSLENFGSFDFINEKETKPKMNNGFLVVDAKKKIFNNKLRKNRK